MADGNRRLRAKTPAAASEVDRTKDLLEILGGKGMITFLIARIEVIVERNSAEKLEDVDGASGEEGNYRQRDERLDHHAGFGPAGKDSGVRGGKGGACVEGEEQIIHEMRGPGGAVPIVIFMSCGRIVGAQAKHLREEEGAVEATARGFAALGTSGVQLPIPESEDENVGYPKSCGGTQQCVGRLAMLRQALNQKEKGSDHGECDCAVGGEREDASGFEIAAAVRDRDRDQQNDHDCQQSPAGADGKRLRQCQVNAAGGEHRYKSGPARFADDFLCGQWIAARCAEGSLI